MKAGVLNDFSLQTTDFSSLENLPDLAFFNEYIGIHFDVGTSRKNFISERRPYRFVEGRVLWVTKGCADVALTLDEYHFIVGDIILLAPETIVELKACSADFSMIGVMFKENIHINKNLIIHAAEKDWHETIQLAKILWNIAQHTPFRHETASHIISAIISDIQDINRAEQEQAPKKRKTRQELAFSKFKKLVNEHCSRHRTIPFYADELNLTPHYLSSLIAKISGQSVMYWINRATLIQAKVLLKNKDMLVSEVADRLNFPSQSAFGYFFKRETGMTPSEYQKAD